MPDHNVSTFEAIMHRLACPSDYLPAFDGEHHLKHGGRAVLQFIQRLTDQEERIVVSAMEFVRAHREANGSKDPKVKKRRLKKLQNLVRAVESEVAQ